VFGSNVIEKPSFQIGNKQGIEVNNPVTIIDIGIIEVMLLLSSQTKKSENRK
jgi:hypothetical protein